MHPMKCRFSEAVDLARKLLEDDPPPGEPLPADDFDPEEMVTSAEQGLNLGAGSTPNFAKWLEKAQSGRGGRRKLENNTYAILHNRPTDAGTYEPAFVAVRLHATDILRFYPDNSVVVNSGGWQTRTTLDRLNKFLPGNWRIYTQKGTWYWSLGYGYGRDSDVIQPYTDGDKINSEGELEAQQHGIHVRRRKRANPAA
jgi:hypothetical protein